MNSKIFKDEPVIITKNEYEKGKKWLKRAHGIEWITCGNEEKEISKKVHEHKVRIVVLGVRKYNSTLYDALLKNGEPTLIVRYGVGYDGIKVDICRQYSIFLVNTPHVLDESVAEHAIAILLAMARNIVYINSEFLKGNFTSKTGFELYGNTIGIAGFGNIGKKVASILCRAFAMDVYAYDIYPLKEQAYRYKKTIGEFIENYCLKGYFTDFNKFSKNVNIVSIHLPSTKDTYHFFDMEKLKQFKRGSILINTSRGNLIDEKALYTLLENGYLGGAALDVFENEPYTPFSSCHDLRTLSNVLLTSHISSNTFESNRRIAEKVVENIQNFINNKYDLLTRVS